MKNALRIWRGLIGVNDDVAVRYHPIAYFNMGLTNQQMGRVRRAKKLYTKCIRSNPQFEEAYIKLTLLTHSSTTPLLTYLLLHY